MTTATENTNANPRTSPAEIFHVYAQYHYYEGTLHAVPNGKVCTYNSETGEREPIAFTSRKAAEAWIRAHTPEIYHLSHGEHSSPTYTIRKAPTPAGSRPSITAADAALVLGSVPHGKIATLRLDGRISGPTHGSGVHMPRIPFDQRWGRAVVAMLHEEDFIGHTRKVWAEARRTGKGEKMVTLFRWRRFYDMPLCEWHVVV